MFSIAHGHAWAAAAAGTGSAGAGHPRTGRTRTRTRSRGLTRSRDPDPFPGPGPGASSSPRGVPGSRTGVSAGGKRRPAGERAPVPGSHLHRPAGGRRGWEGFSLPSGAASARFDGKRWARGAAHRAAHRAFPAGAAPGLRSAARRGKSHRENPSEDRCKGVTPLLAGSAAPGPAPAIVPPVDSFEVTLGNSSSTGARRERSGLGLPAPTGSPFPGPDSPPPPRRSPGEITPGFGRGVRGSHRATGENKQTNKQKRGKREVKNGCGGATAPGGGGTTTTRYLPKEVVFAVKLAFSRKAFLCQIAFTFTALNTLHMPSPVQYIQQKPVQDWPFAACTVNHCLWLFLRAGGSGFPDVKQKKKRKKKLRIKKNNKKFSKRRQHRRRFAFFVCLF